MSLFGNQEIVAFLFSHDSVFGYMKHHVRPGFFNFNYRSPSFKPSKEVTSYYRYNCVESVLHYLQEYWTLNLKKAHLMTIYCDGGPIIESEWDCLIYYEYIVKASKDYLIQANKEWKERNKNTTLFSTDVFDINSKQEYKIGKYAERLMSQTRTFKQLWQDKNGTVWKEWDFSVAVSEN